ncbi:MAG: hypothetical protein V7727_12785 [Sneathiella sp.]
MTHKQHLFGGSIPENYERYFVPLIFADYAVKFAELLDVKNNMKVLETARHIVLGFVAGGPLANEIMTREKPNFETAIEALEKDIQEQFGEGECRAKMQAIQFTAHLS